MVFEKRWSRVSVARDSRRKVGRIRKVLARSALRRAVVWNTVFEAWISERSCPRRSERARKVSPPLRTSWRTARRWVSRMRSTRLADCSNGGSSPIAAERSAPRPRKASACCCIQTWNAWRVGWLNVRNISSRLTEGATLAAARLPPSGSGVELLLPGVSSTYVSPRSVFWRRIALVSVGIGA